MVDDLECMLFVTERRMLFVTERLHYLMYYVVDFISMVLSNIQHIGNR